MKFFNHLSENLFKKVNLRYLLLITAVLFCIFAKAQVVKPTTPVVANAPTVFSMGEFRKSPQYAKRKAAYDKAVWPQVKKLSFPHNHTLTITINKVANSTKDLPPTQKKVTPPKTTSSGGYDCTTTMVEYNANSDNFLNNPYAEASAHIYPGACYTLENLMNGSWKEEKGVRNSITIGTTNTNIKSGFHTYTQVNAPDFNSVNDAIATIKRGFSGCANLDTYYQVTDVENEAVYNLAIGAGASGFGADISNQYSTVNQSKNVHLTIDATKTLFIMQSSIPDGGFFKDANIEATPYLSVIGEVSYGIRILANADFQFSSEEEADNFKASYSGFGLHADLSVDYGSSSKNVSVKINANIIGGPGGSLVAYSLADLKTQINKIMGSANCNNVQPIKYQTFTMAGDVLNTTSATDQIPVRNCLPVGKGEEEIQSIALNILQGGDGKEASTQFSVFILPSTTPAGTDEPMFIYDSRQSGLQKFENNSSNTVILTRNKNYKGTFDMASFQKAGGGRLIINLIIPEAGHAVGVDVWQITGLVATFEIKATTGNPGAIGSKKITYPLAGANQINLDNSNWNLVKKQLTFDKTFNPL
jgi:hypothetical protein